MALHFEGGERRDAAEREAMATEQYIAGLVREAEMTMRSTRVSEGERAANLDAIRAEVERVGGDADLLPDVSRKVTRQSVQAEARKKPGRPRKVKASES
jgi:hypothetical protein